MTTDISQARAGNRFAFFSSIQALRGVAAMLVVLYHLVDAERIYGRGPMLLGGVARFGFVGVDVFFVISGFVMMTIASDRFGRSGEAGDFLIRRAVRILPLYWLYTTAVVVLLLIPHAVDASYHAKSVWASYLLWPQQAQPLLQVGWTLIYEAFFYLVVAGAIALVSAGSRVAFLACWATVLLCLQATEAYTPWFAVIRDPMGFEFIAGAFVSIFYSRLPVRAGSAALALGLLGAAVAVWCMNRVGLVDQDHLRRTLVFGSCAVLIVAGLTRRESAGMMGAHRWWHAIGDASYSIYLSHLFVVTLMARFWGRSGLNGSVMEHVGFILVVMAASVCVGLVSYRLIERPMVTWLGQRLGRRKARPMLAQSAV